MSSKLFKSIFTLTSIAALAACGGDPAPQIIAASPVVAVISAANVAVVGTAPVTFPGGVPALKTTAATTVAFTSPTAFRIASGTSSATGVTTYGSCIFTFTASTFAVGSGPQVGDVLTVNPCTSTFNTAGVPADGSAQTVTGTLTLGGVTSSGTQTTVTISPAGVVTVNGVTAGSASVTTRTGG